MITNGTVYKYELRICADSPTKARELALALVNTGNELESDHAALDSLTEANDEDTHADVDLVDAVVLVDEDEDTVTCPRCGCTNLTVVNEEIEHLGVRGYRQGAVMLKSRDVSTESSEIRCDGCNARLELPDGVEFDHI